MVLPEHTIPRFLFCKHHVLNLFVLQTSPIAQSPLSSKFLIFFLPSLLQSCPLASLSFILVSVQLQFVNWWWFGSAVISPWWIWWLLFLYCRCVTTVLYVYHVHGKVISVHAVYSTVCTMVGVSLPYRVHVLLQYKPHGTVVSVHPVNSTWVRVFILSLHHVVIVLKTVGVVRSLSWKR